MNLHFSISDFDIKSSIKFRNNNRSIRETRGVAHPPHASKSLRRQQEGLKTNVRDDRSEFPFYHSDGWGMLRVVIKGWEPSSWSLSKCFIILSNFINPSSRDNLISSRPLLRNPFLETFYPKNVWRLTIARLIRFENVSRSLCNEIRCGEDCIFLFSMVFASLSNYILEYRREI